MRWFRLCAFGALIATNLSSPTFSAEGTPALRLSAHINGRVVTEFLVENGEIRAREAGETRTVPAGTQFRLEGDLWAHSELLGLSPAHEILCPPPMVGVPRLERTFSALVFAMGNAPGGWTRQMFKRAIVVFVWVVDGRPRFVAIEPAGAMAENRDQNLAALHSFDLNAESARGLPVLLLLGPDGFVPAAPHFEHTSARHLLLALHAGASDGDERLSAPLRDPALVQATNANRHTLLHFAAEAGTTWLIDRLLANGADPRTETTEGTTALDLAAANGRRETARARWNALGGTPPASRRDTVTPAFARAMKHGHFDLGLTLQQAAPADVVRDTLIGAVDHGRVDVVQALLDLRTKGFAGTKVLPELAAHAIWHDHATVLDYLHARGLDLNARVDHTPLLIHAAQAGTPATIAACLRAGATVDAVDEQGMTALMHCANRGLLPAAEAFLGAGANVRRVDKTKRTALHHAAAAGQESIVAALLAHGAVLEVSDKTGATPLDLACEARAPAVIDRLVAAGDRLPVKSRTFRESIILACELDRPDLLRAAHADGWNPRAAMSESWTAWQIAQVTGATNSIAWLETVLSAEDRTGYAVELQPDQPAALQSGSSAFDVRPRNRDHPAVAAELRTTIDAEGRPRFPTIRGCDDARLASAIINAAQTWRFRPAQKAGRAVASTLALAIKFPARNSTVFAPDQVDLRPAVTRHVEVEASTIRKDYVVERPNTVRSVHVPTLSRSGQPTTVEQSVVTSYSTERFTDFAIVRDEWALLRCLVETDGTPSNIEIIQSPFPAFAQRAAVALAQSEFLPANRAGRPVRSWMTVTLRSNASSSSDTAPGLSTGVR